MAKGLPELLQCRPFPPFLQEDLLGLGKVHGKYILHLSGKIPVQDNRVHLVIA